jgi:hypothetical protein
MCVMPSQNYKLWITVVVQCVAKHYTVKDSVQCKYLRAFSISLNCLHSNLSPGWLIDLCEAFK